MSRPLSTTNPSVIKAVEVVKEFSTAGITIDEISVRCGWSLAHTKNVMTAASNLGLAKPVQTQNRIALWFLPQRAEWFRRVQAESARVLKAQRAQEYFRPSRSADELTESLDPYLLRDLPDEPMHRVVPAASAPPVVTAGVRSIFDIGVMA